MALLLVLAGWTLFVWGTRISNILSDGDGAPALAVALGLVLLAVAVAWHAVRGRLPWSVPALAAATVAVWAVRLPAVLLHDHGVAFKAVHFVLGAVSVALASAALRSRQRVPV